MVFELVIIQSNSLRILYTSALASSEVIHFESPVFVAIFPSIVVAVFKTTYGSFLVIFFIKTLFKNLASSSRIPTVTSMPFSFNFEIPSTFGLTSFMPITTRFSLRSIIKSTQGGVLPKCEHGSRFTYKVPPFASFFCNFIKASRSAWLLPYLWWYPFETTFSFLSRTTQPTIGLGKTLPYPFLASLRHSFMYFSSLFGNCLNSYFNSLHLNRGLGRVFKLYPIALQHLSCQTLRTNHQYDEPGTRLVLNPFH